MQSSILDVMAECFVRSSLIAIGAGALLFLLRVRDARVRHAVWACVAIWMLGLPAWTAWGPRAAVRLTNPGPMATLNAARVSTSANARSASEPSFGAKAAWNWQVVSARFIC